MVSCPSCASANPDAARFCSHCGNPLDAPRPVEGERKIATVLFADVVRSTAMAEALDPEDWAAVMNGAFGFMNTTIHRYGGTVARLMGDAVLAFFGAPVAQEDHAERAVRAALDLVAGAGEYAHAIRDRYGLEFQIRVGIHTGTAVLALVGDQVRAEYTAMGDTSNLAARLQGAAEAGMVLISGDTHRLVRGLFDTESVGPLQVKGKRAPVEAFAVIQTRSRPGPTRGLEGLRSTLVGRERELDLLTARVARLDEGAGSVVAIVGEAGIGKSRLVAEIRDGFRARPELAWHECRAVSYGQSVPYHPWQELGKQMIGAEAGDPPVRIRALLTSFLDRLGLGTDSASLLETMLAVDEGRAGGSDALDGQALTQRIADAVMACIRAAITGEGGTRPHVLVFDDLHWADGASLDLLSQVATLAVGEPLLVLCLLRPDRTAVSWPLLDRLEGSLGASYLRLDLEPLDPVHSRELLGRLLHIEGLPDQVRTLILERSEGNPFFLEEILRSLIDCGQVVRDNGHWRATREIEGVTIPDTLAGVLSARIDRLPDPTKRTAQSAAVLGRIFPYRALVQLCGSAPAPDRIANVDPHLGTLAYEELVRERARHPEREYIFKHALTQEAAYGLLLKQKRRVLHLRAGLALETVFPDRLQELAPVLAHHFHEGGDPARGAEYSVRAAERSRKLFAVREARDHYDRACRALESLPDPDPTTLSDAILGWAFIKYKLAEYDGVIARLERAEALARGLEDRTRLARTLSWIATMHVLTGFPSRAGPYIRESHELVSELGDRQLLILPFFWTTESILDREPARAADQLEEVIEMAREYGVPEIEGHALAAKAVAHARLGEFDVADQYIARALELAPSGGHKVKEADVHIVVGIAYYEMGDLAKGVEHGRRGAELAQAAAAIECACAGYFGLGTMDLDLKELDRALDHFSRSLGLADFADWEGYVNRIRAGVAAAEFARGEVGAVDRMEQALENARDDHDEFAVATIGLNLTEAYLRLGDAGRARARLEPAVAFFRETGMKSYIARALGLAADLADHEGQEAEARRLRDEETTLRASFRRGAPAGAS
jgi:class 3 adenylate cyclase/tetratricopeptide (TPR) repeat protein